MRVLLSSPRRRGAGGEVKKALTELTLIEDTSSFDAKQDLRDYIRNHWMLGCAVAPSNLLFFAEIY